MSSYDYFDNTKTENLLESILEQLIQLNTNFESLKMTAAFDTGKGEDVTIKPMPEGKLLWYGEPVGDMTKEQLIEIVRQLARQQKPQIAFNNLFDAQEFAKMLKDEM